MRATVLRCNAVCARVGMMNIADSAAEVAESVLTNVSLPMICERHSVVSQYPLLKSDTAEDLQPGTFNATGGARPSM